MNRLFKWLTIILALMLPWHGAITVFLPDFFRYWKETVLILFFIGLCLHFFKNKKQKLRNMLEFREISKSPLTYTFLFLIYGFVLIIFNAEKTAALMAFRYLGMGFSVYSLFYLLSRNIAGFRTEFIEKFSRFFAISSLFAVLFGTWVKFGNGASFLQNFYSQTISSWVPGQTIPLWHEAGDFIRMQGASSGPIEFSHILLGALFLTLISKIKNLYKLLFSAIFLWGIYQSYSRAAILAALIVLGFFCLQKINFDFLKKKIVIIVVIIVISLAGLLGIKNSNILSRAGTSDHFTRPIKAAKFGLDNFLSNNLSKIGPIARETNLKENNDDRAMIAENVFVDVFAQMGVLGVIFYIMFFCSLVKNLKPEFYGFLGASFIVMNLATIFDMTPVAISFFVIFFLSEKDLV